MASERNEASAIEHPPQAGGRRTGPCRVMLLGATGTIGRATALALVQRGHDVVCFVRRTGGDAIAGPGQALQKLPAEVTIRQGEVRDPSSFARDGFRGERFDALVSCMASRTGAPRDAWAIDHAAHVDALHAAREAGVSQMVLLSAICVQKPMLGFQHAKLAFEKALIASELDHSIVRPTAFFKSLSGQVDRVKQGKPFLVFGSGEMTACKPISDRDLGEYIAGCLEDPQRRNRVLPIGGPGDAITPLQQGMRLFELMGGAPRFRHVPVRMLDAIVAGLAAGGRVLPLLAAKAELARIGRYYATESMLVWDAANGAYDAQATPSTGTDTLFDYYVRLIDGSATPERGDHAVF